MAFRADITESALAEAEEFAEAGAAGPSDWGRLTLGEICARAGGSIQTGPFGSQLHASDYTTLGVPVVMPVNIGENRIAEEGIVRIPPSEAARLERHKLRVGNIVYGRRGDIGRRALITKSEDGWLCGSGCLRIDFGTGVLDPEFATYFLSNPDTRDWIVQRAVGTTMLNLNTAILSAVPFLVPPLSEQKEIGRALGALDDKIDLNRRMNQTLESIARAIFRSWFVDFDPVVAKAAGRQPFGMAADVARHFSSHLASPEAGSLPDGWGVSDVGREFSVVMGQSPPGDTYNEKANGLAFYQGRTDFGSRYPRLRMFCTSPTRFADAGDTLISVRAPVGGLNIALLRCCVGRGLAAVRHKSGSSAYTYYALWSLEEEFDKFNADGTVFGSISKGDFHRVHCIAPPQEVIAAYAEMAAPLDGLIETNTRQSTTLAALRDTLLPKLMSGELRLRDAEKLVGAHV